MVYLNYVGKNWSLPSVCGSNSVCKLLLTLAFDIFVALKFQYPNHFSFLNLSFCFLLLWFFFFFAHPFLRGDFVLSLSAWQTIAWNSVWVSNSHWYRLFVLCHWLSSAHGHKVFNVLYVQASFFIFPFPYTLVFPAKKKINAKCLCSWMDIHEGKIILHIFLSAWGDSLVLSTADCHLSLHFVFGSLCQQKESGVHLDSRFSKHHNPHSKGEAEEEHCYCG